MNWKTTQVKTDQLKPHPRNYHSHPEDQLDHLCKSIEEHGFYRNIVATSDNTILAGHGVVQAALKMKIETVPVLQLSLAHDDPRALKILVGDNEMGRLSMPDDRALSELLKEIKETDPFELLGTGYDEMMLANLAMVSRPASEIQDFDAAAHWVGMPDYGEVTKRISLIVHFESYEDRLKFGELLGIALPDNLKYIHWPDNGKEDFKSIRFEG